MNTNLPQIDDDRFIKLIGYLRDLGKAAVAFSGGVDSTFLLAAAKIALDGNVVAMTIDSPALPRYELEEAVNLAKLIDVKHIIIKSNDIEDTVKHNPVNRCYFCKKMEYGTIRGQAEKLGIQNILDGSNADDLKDFRPGMKATREVRVLSPLLENGLTKEEIRSFSKTLGLPTWDKPAYACLYSRIPYHHEIKIEDLEKVEKSEKFFIDRGIRTIRVRCHDKLARIEVNPSEIDKLLDEPLKSAILQTLRSYGFEYITVDLAGYRQGSFNPRE